MLSLYLLLLAIVSSNGQDYPPGWCNANSCEANENCVDLTENQGASHYCEATTPATPEPTTEATTPSTTVSTAATTPEEPRVVYRSCGGDVRSYASTISFLEIDDGPDRSEECLWKINAIVPIQFTFQRFAVVDDQGTSYLTINEQRYSGHDPDVPQHVGPVQGVIEVKLTISPSFSEEGFSIDIDTVRCADNPCQANEVCTDIDVNTIPTFHCAATTPATTPEPPTQATTPSTTVSTAATTPEAPTTMVYSSCGGDVRSYASTITYPESGKYQNDIVCIWNINASVPIIFKWQRLDTRKYFDYVIIHGRGRSGHKTPADYGPVQGEIEVEFRSGLGNTFTGFSVNIDTVRCAENPCPENEVCTDIDVNMIPTYHCAATTPATTPEPPTEGISVYTSCGGDVRYYASQITYPESGEYGNREDCEWRLTAPVPVNIHFERFSTEPGNDKLSVNQIQFSGYATPGDVGPLTGSIILTFTSDSSMTGPGFSLTIDPVTCADNPCHENQDCTAVVSGQTETYHCEEKAGTSTELGDDGFTVECDEIRVTGAWEKDLFGSNYVDISMRDESCRGYQENATHLFVEINFSLCGSTMVENGDLIVQENKAKVVVSDVESESVERYRTHYYSMTCTFDRKLNVSTAYGFETEVASDINFARSDETTFNASIDIYDTSSYNTISPNPITVTLTEPLFIGIQGSNNNENFKMIVNQCYATATADRHSNNRYLFFDMRCPIDTTFEMTGNSNTHFNYRIDAFTFIAVRGSVFIHCNMYICLADSTASACQQTCHVRKRRAITQESDDEALPLKEVGVTTLEIVFEKKTLCSETTCPSNSRCWELYPAVCRCDEGYVFDEGTRRCHSERVLPIFGLQLDMEFISTYADPTSTDFLKLAANIEKQLTTSFRSRDKNIVGVKVISARKGSVVLDLLITYANTTRREDAFQTFVQHVMATDIPEEERLDIKIKREILPTTERQHTLEQQHASEKQPPVEEVRITNTMLLVATVLPALLIIVAVVVVLAVKRTQSRKKGEKDVEGFDNTSVSMENLS